MKNSAIAEEDDEDDDVLSPTVQKKPALDKKTSLFTAPAGTSGGLFTNKPKGESFVKPSVGAPELSKASSILDSKPKESSLFTNAPKPTQATEKPVIKVNLADATASSNKKPSLFDSKPTGGSLFGQSTGGGLF